ncbi:helix-turn-helix transcriptional regulator [Myroides sp. 1354]|uniref:helix-turn-helix domain-containing protein n=1 Tax=unclassified Myroides TaxID=2642485 RepID=UPI0025791CBD|nr:MULTISPECIES: response regulator transcription factor [unclassified Myroides]MDM1044841.1 helix-turn-helix transcriptional regulator [Myroides sp. R163-1]MDM1055554.1 helix-turn-helix transcriptional regulator [Myroides sp. 1354]MDM1068851.1 helix-turn-helix transcriptional regulator [Myroides sp. 1372]
MKHISAISEFHKLLDLPAPLHPLISLVDVTQMHITENDIWKKFTLDFYSISLKRNVTAKVKYGQQYYDFDKGTMNFLAPKQIQSLEVDEVNEISQNCGLGYMLMIHPDFLYNHPLGSQIKTYGFFSYSLNEALHLSEKEEGNIIEIFQKIEHEYQFIDRHTQDIILSQLDLLLNYSNRFYERQFITRKAVNNDLLSKTEQVLTDYFNGEEKLVQGVPTVEFLASQLHLSPSYLSDMLRSLTGQSAKQHIHNTLINKAKEYLSTTTLSVAEIAYLLGFEYPQSFNKLFKKKTDMSPLAFRANFN